jgi:hypothetical protein
MKRREQSKRGYGKKRSKEESMREKRELTNRSAERKTLRRERMKEGKRKMRNRKSGKTICSKN